MERFHAYHGVLSAALTYLLIGLGLGLVTSIPVGVVNGTVIDVAARHGQRSALGLAIGGALADAVIAFAGIAGIGVAIAQAPTWRPALYCVSGVVLAAVGVVILRNTRPEIGEPKERAKFGVGAAFAVGFTLTLLNPAALFAWVAVGAWLELDNTMLALNCAIGVGIGTGIVFSGFAIAAARGLKGKPKRLKIVGTIVGVLLLVLGAAALGRGIYGLVI